jgi:uncharacterized iron-regulated protein
MSFQEILTELEKAQVIFVGEMHGIASSHRVELEVIRHLHLSGKKVAVALEMFPDNKQVILDRWADGTLNEKYFRKAYFETWRIPYRYYSAIFAYAKREHIPLFGVNADDTYINRVSKTGLAEVPEDLLKSLKFTSCLEDPEYSRLLGLFGKREYHTSGLPFLCDGQRLRDAVMAYNIFTILERQDFTVVVLAGAAHAVKAAVPGTLQKHREVSYRVLLPREFTTLLKREPDTTMADYIWD